MNGAGESSVKRLAAGDVVLAKSGRDGGGYFLVVGTEDGYVYLADGKRRKLCNPKRKNEKHVQRTRMKLSEWETMSDKALRAALGALFETETNHVSVQGRKELV